LAWNSRGENVVRMNTTECRRREESNPPISQFSGYLEEKKEILALLSSSQNNGRWNATRPGTQGEGAGPGRAKAE